MYCIGCDKYFCKKDFTGHQNFLSGEMEKIVEYRNQLQEAINNSIESNGGQNSPVIAEIDKWEKSTIKKVKDIAAQARERAIQLLTSNQTKIQIKFQDFSKELAALRESEDFVEPDLDRLNQMIIQFKLDIKQSMQPTTIKLNTEQSDQVVWENLIYVDEIGRQQELKQQEMRRQQQEQEMKQQKELQQQQQEQEMKRQKELLQQQQEDMRRQQGLLQQQQQDMKRQQGLLLQQQQQQQQQQRIGMFSKYRFFNENTYVNSFLREKAFFFMFIINLIHILHNHVLS